MQIAPHSPPTQAHVALESTVIAHGLPYPQNRELARTMEEIVRERGATPRTVGIVNGQPMAGLEDEQIEMFARSAQQAESTEEDGTNNGEKNGETVHKISQRNLAIAVARGWHGATTVATTMWIAHRAGIPVFATGGIGGVHRPDGTGRQFDVSADLVELARTPVIVVCAGAKAILDLPATLEYLETHGVTVVGMGTEEFPAFYSRSSGLAVDVCCHSAREVADIWQTKQRLNLPGGLLVTVPVPAEEEIPAAEIEPVIERALDEANARGLRSAAVTPFLLARIAELTGDRSLRANVALLHNNARVASDIAVALTESPTQLA